MQRTKKPKVWNIKAVKEQLGPEICSNILFLHAVLGCDTTSHLYGINWKGHFSQEVQIKSTLSRTSCLLQSQQLPRKSPLQENKH